MNDIDKKPADDLIGPAEAAEQVGMSRSAFDRAWKAGELPQPRITGGGRVVRFYKPALDHWVKTGELTTPEQRQSA
jgi:excisionase family DNA binding protein